MNRETAVTNNTDKKETESLRGLLDRIKLKRGFGIYVEDNKLYFAEVVRTPLRSILQKSDCRDLSKSSFEDNIVQLLPSVASKSTVSKKAAADKKKKSILLSSAIPGNELFYAGSIISEDGSKKLDRRTLISEIPRFAFINSSDIVSDWFSCKLSSRNFVFMGAAKSIQVNNILQDFYKVNINPERIEPEAWAALRASFYYTRTKISRGSLEIRFLLNTSTILAILTNGKIPLAWQYRKYGSSDLSNVLYSLSNSLIVFANWRLKLEDIVSIVIQGGEDVSGPAGALEEEFRIPVSVSPVPSFSGDTVAFGLALGGVSENAHNINLARSIRKAPSLYSLIPRFEAIITTAIVLLVLLNTWSNIDNYSRRLRSVKIDNASSDWSIGKNLFILTSEKQQLSQQVVPIGNFLANKINWSPYLESLGGLVPDNAWVDTIEVEDQIWSTSISNKGKRYLMIRMFAAFPPGGKAPDEIDEAVKSFRDNPLFQKELPKVQLAEINWKKEEAKEYAFFSLLASPKMVQGQ